MERYELKNRLGATFSEKLAEKHRYSSLAKHYNPTANNLVTSVMRDLERNHIFPRLESSKTSNHMASTLLEYENALQEAMGNRQESLVRLRQKPKYARKAHEIPKPILREKERIPVQFPTIEPTDQVRASIKVVQDELIACYQLILEETGDTKVRYFIGNAIKCYQQKIYPEAITALWKAAVCLLSKYVLLMHPREFNDVAKNKTRNNWKEAKTIDDLASSMKESVFLDCLEAISVISPIEKKQLRSCLTLRNIHSHPNSVEITPLVTATYFETLLLHVFNRFQYMDGPEFTVH